jgi:hypothetical protein
MLYQTNTDSAINLSRNAFVHVAHRLSIFKEILFEIIYRRTPSFREKKWKFLFGTIYRKNSELQKKNYLYRLTLFKNFLSLSWKNQQVLNIALIFY